MAAFVEGTDPARPTARHRSIRHTGVCRMPPFPRARAPPPTRRATSSVVQLDCAAPGRSRASANPRRGLSVVSYLPRLWRAHIVSIQCVYPSSLIRTSHRPSNFTTQSTCIFGRVPFDPSVRGHTPWPRVQRPHNHHPTVLCTDPSGQGEHFHLGRAISRS